MIARLLAPLALIASAPLMAQAPAATTAPAQATGLTIGGEAILPADIVDARAIPDLEGPPVIMITLNDGGVQKLMAATRGGNAGQMIMVPIAIDGQKITDIVTTEVRGDPVLTFTLRGRTIDQATALAKRISGRDPVPEEFAE